MELSMTVLRCPDQVAPEARSVSGGEFHVGRGPDVDWVLPDPDRLLSKRHFAVAYLSGAWQIADTSTNGTFLNSEGDPIGRGATRALRDGDRIRLGAYEIELRLVEQPAYGDSRGAAAGFGGGSGRSSQPSFGDPFAQDLMAPTPQARRPFDEAAYPDLGLAPGAQLPHDFDPLAPEHGDDPYGGGFRGPVQSDHSSSMDDAMIPPPVASYETPHAGGANLIPDDWDNLLDDIAPHNRPRRRRLRRRRRFTTRRRLALPRAAPCRSHPRLPIRRLRIPRRPILCPGGSAIRRRTTRDRGHRRCRPHRSGRRRVRRLHCHRNPRRCCRTRWISTILWHPWSKRRRHHPNRCRPHRSCGSGPRVRRRRRPRIWRPRIWRPRVWRPQVWRHGMPSRSARRPCLARTCRRRYVRSRVPSTLRMVMRHGKPSRRRLRCTPRTRIRRRSTNRRICRAPATSLPQGPLRRLRRLVAAVRPAAFSRRPRPVAGPGLWPRVWIMARRWRRSSRGPNSAAPHRRIPWP